ncbi:MAG: GNAT family N-acetyltransferase [Planctomycetaceae bacterium]|nr:GNAT family N-acetyltransferase [Planctomycetaceae bacterium]
MLIAYASDPQRAIRQPDGRLPPGTVVRLADDSVTWLAAQVSNQCLAIASISMESDGQAAMIAPMVLPDVASEEARAACRLLLQTIRQLAITAERSMLRCLVSIPLDPCGEQLLREAGLFPATIIETMQSDAIAPSQPRSTESSHVTPEQSSALPVTFHPHVSDRSAQLQPVLSSILASSADLRCLPAPSPDSLLREWRKSDACLLTVGEEETPVGILVCAPISTISRNEAESCNNRGKQNSSQWQIHYLGVVPAMRGRGHATQLLRALPFVLARDTATAPLTLTAYVDQANVAARRTWLCAGYRCIQSQQLFVSDRLLSRSDVS